MDEVLTSYINQKNVEHIQWEICGQCLTEMYVTDFDLCTIFTKLLSNGVDSCNNVDKQNRFIHVDIKWTDIL